MQLYVASQIFFLLLPFGYPQTICGAGGGSFVRVFRVKLHGSKWLRQLKRTCSRGG